MDRSDRIKIMFVLPSVEAGGAQRFMVNMLSWLDRGRFLPILVLSKKKGEYLDQIPHGVPIYDLGRRSRYDFPRLVIQLAAIIRRERPHILFSTLPHADTLAILSRFASRVPCKAIIVDGISHVGFESNYQYYSRMYRGFLIWMCKTLYPQADMIVAVSEGVRRDILANFVIAERKVIAAYNPLDVERVKRLAEEEVSIDWNPEGLPIIAAMGRMDDGHKGFSILIRAFAKVREQDPVKLMLIGDGPDFEFLRGLTITLGVEKDVAFLGFQENPYKYVARATVFAFPSLYEGFPNALAEAMAVGVPIVAAACPHGPAEMLVDGESGLLVPVADEKALATAIVTVLRDEVFRKKLARAARERAEMFSPERTVRKYEEIFLSVLTLNRKNH